MNADHWVKSAQLRTRSSALEDGTNRSPRPVQLCMQNHLRYTNSHPNIDQHFFIQSLPPLCSMATDFYEGTHTRLLQSTNMGYYWLGGPAGFPWHSLCRPLLEVLKDKRIHFGVSFLETSCRCWRECNQWQRGEAITRNADSQDNG